MTEPEWDKYSTLTANGQKQVLSALNHATTPELYQAVMARLLAGDFDKVK